MKNLFLRDEFEAYGEVFVATEAEASARRAMCPGRDPGAEPDGGCDTPADRPRCCAPSRSMRRKKGIKCYISLEEKMACGISACLACVCQSKDVDHHSNVQQADLQGWSRIFSRGGRIMRQMAVNLAGVEA